MNRLIGIGAAVVLLLSSFAAFGQASVTNLPSLAATELQLANEGNHDLYFLLRPKGGPWTEYMIRSGESEAYECEDCQEMEFFMRTGEKSVHYILRTEDRFVLRWNGNEQLWDLYRVTK